MGFGAGRGAGLAAAAFLAGAFFAGAFLAGAFFAAAFFAGAFAEAAAFFAGGLLAAEGREAIGARLPPEAAPDTCALCFTRSCRGCPCGS
ncbi:hypothetical protein CF54_06820 [Streptomyces sp. Tu 6176]|nr:hypothetical protein CF54_06820 [Streptomyces sp. Tu 6176]